MVWSITCKEYARDQSGYAGDLTKVEWEKIKPHLLPLSRMGRPRTTYLCADCACYKSLLEAKSSPASARTHLGALIGAS